MEVFPQPVGIPMVSQIITGSIQAVPAILTPECEAKNEIRIISPLRTADEETLNALPTCSHPYNSKIRSLVNKYFCSQLANNLFKHLTTLYTQNLTIRMNSG